MKLGGPDRWAGPCGRSRVDWFLEKREGRNEARTKTDTGGCGE
jgi:hypothetical protein